MKINVVIADDHKIIRDGLCALIEKQPDMEVIAEAENGKEAVDVAQKLSPDVVIMDITMPGMNGIEATRRIVENNPAVKVIGLSMHSAPEFVSGILNAGASGYILKECAFSQIVQAIQALVQNKSYICPEVASVVIDGFKERKTSDHSDDTSPLTDREREVLQLITEGYSSKEIAAQLNLSNKTIDSHRQNIMDKLHCHDVVKLTKYAIRMGITSAEI